MAIHSRFNDLVYTTKQDAKQFDLTNIKESTGLVLATADNLQKRAVANKNAANELAIKLSEQNAVEGEDQLALEGKVNDTMKYIDDKVNEEGHWAFADTVVTEASKNFLTDKDVKKLFESKAKWDFWNEQNAKSDASEEFKQMARAKALEEYNKNGGALNGATFGNYLGSGHNRKEIRDEILNIFDKMKADKNFMYIDEFKSKVIDAAKNDPNAPSEIPMLASILNQDNTLYGYQGITKHIEGISDDKLMNIAKYIVQSDPKYRQAYEVEANLLMWNYEKQGINIPYIVINDLQNKVLSDPSSKIQLIKSSETYKNADVATKKMMLQNPDANKDILIEGFKKEFYDYFPNSDNLDFYEDYMKSKFMDNYVSDTLNGFSTYASSLAYQQVTGDVDTKWFTDLYKKQSSKAEGDLKDLGVQYDKVYSMVGNVPGKEETLEDIENKQLSILESQAAAVEAAIRNIRNSNGNRVLSPEEEAELNSLTDHLNNINEQIRNKGNAAEIYLQNLDFAKNKKDIKDMVESSIDDIIEDIKLAKFAIFPNPVIFDKLTYDKIKIFDDIKNNIVDKDYNSISELESKIDEAVNESQQKYNFKFEEGIKKYIKEFVTKNLYKKGKKNNLIEDKSIPSYFIGSSEEGGKTEALFKEIGEIISNDPGRMTVKAMTIATKNGKKVDGDWIDTPMIENKDLKRFLSVESKGEGSNTMFDEANLKYELVASENGNYAIRIIRPIQGRTDIQLEAIVESNDTGFMDKLKNISYHIRQNSVNRLSLIPNDETARLNFNRLSSVDGASIPLGYNALSDVESKFSDLYQGNIVAGKYASTVGQALNNIIYDNIQDTKGYIFYPGGLRVRIAKNIEGEYMTEVSVPNGYTDEYGNSITSWEPIAKGNYLNSNDFKTDLQKDLSKILNTENYKNAFRPITSDIEALIENSKLRGLFNSSNLN